MSDDPVKQSIAELQDLVRCRCHPAYTGRGMHDPDCECDSADAVKVVADRIEKLEAENKMLSEGATIAHFQGVMYAHNNMADAIWNEFKDRWEGERKYALRQIVRWLKNEKAPGDEAEGQ